MKNNIINDLKDTCGGDRQSHQKTVLTIKLPILNDEIQNKTFDEINLQAEAVKIIILSSIIDIYTIFEALLGLKLSGHFDKLTEASNLTAEINKKGERQNEQQYRNAPNKFQT